MEIVTSGLDEVPTHLTTKGLWDLTFKEYEFIYKRFFVLQIINVQYDQPVITTFSGAERKSSVVQPPQLNQSPLRVKISDGVAFATALINRDDAME